MGCGCGGKRKVVRGRGKRRPAVEWVVRDGDGREIATYLTKYEADTHAQKSGYPPPIVRRG